MNHFRDQTPKIAVITGLFFLIVMSLLFVSVNESLGYAYARFTPTPTPSVSPTPVPTIPPRTLPRDLVYVPDEIQQLEIIIASGLNVYGAEPGWNHTSDFMLGTVAVSLVLPDCDESVASCTQGGWTPDEVNQVMSEIQDAFNWWQQKADDAGVGENLSIYLVTSPPEIVPTSYEPIDLPGGGDSLCGDEALWVDEVMANLGYDDFAGGNTYLLEVRQYNNDLREEYGTDWAFTIFVVDSSHNPGGFFALTDCNGQADPFAVAAWAHLSGPFFAMNTINNGYGNHFMDGVAAHEMGHIFGAPDEAPSWSCKLTEEPTCNTEFGYLGEENQNCNPCMWSSVPCTNPCNTINIGNSLMRASEDYGTGINESIIHYYTEGHVGWHDSDNDSLSDPIDTTPVIELSPPNNPDVDRMYTGIAEDIPFPSALPNSSSWHPAYPDETINKITSVQYQVNGGGWFPAQPQDVFFDSAMEEYFFSPLICESGTYIINVKATNSVGNVSSIETDTINVSVPEACTRSYLPIIFSSSLQLPTLPSVPQNPEGYPPPSSYP